MKDGSILGVPISVQMACYGGLWGEGKAFANNTLVDLLDVFSCDSAISEAFQDLSPFRIICKYVSLAVFNKPLQKKKTSKRR